MTITQSNEGPELSALRMLQTLGPTQGFDVVARLAPPRGACASHSDAYALLYTLESRGLIEGHLEPSPDGGERRWYSLTARGHRSLAKLASVADEAALTAAVPARGEA